MANEIRQDCCPVDVPDRFYRCGPPICASAQAATKAYRAADARHRPKEAALVRPRMGTSSLKVLPKASGTPWGREPVLRACRLLHVATRTPVSERSRKTFSYSESAWSVGLRSAWIS